MSRSARRPPSVLWTICAKETRELLRDRRAVFFAFVLPLFLYPLVFLGVSALPRAQQDELETRRLDFGLDPGLVEILEHVRPEDHLRAVIRPLREADLKAGNLPIHIARADRPGDEERSEEPSRAGESGPAEGAPPPLAIRVVHLHSMPASREALKRVRKVIDRWRRAIRERRLRERGVEVSTADLVRAETIDIARPGEKSAVAFGRIAPFLLIFLLLTGGSFAAIDLLAGEKERHTLETLCVQAVSRGEIIGGKFLVVVGASLASVVLNLAGLLLAIALGLTPRLPGGEVSSVPEPSVILTMLLLLVPLAVLTSGLLLAVSAYARSYREAQTYLFPISLLALLPILLAVSPQVKLAGVVSLVPLANVALALREAIAGGLEPWPAVVVVLSTTVYAALMLRHAAISISREEVLLGLEPPALPVDIAGEARARRALGFGAGMLLLVYLAAPRLQAGDLVSFPVGLALTLWGVVLVPALLYAAFARRPFLAALGLRRARLLDLALVLPAALSAALLAAAWMELQQGFLPLPEEVGRRMEELLGAGSLGAPMRFFLFALSPGIAEELLWRGAVQSDLEARGRPWRTVLIVGFFFGLFHLSLHRFAATAAVGGILAFVRWRSGSILPCMLLHTAYNAVSLFLFPRFPELFGGPDRPESSLGAHPWLLAGAAVVLLGSLRALGRGAERGEPIGKRRAG